MSKIDRPSDYSTWPRDQQNAWCHSNAPAVLGSASSRGHSSAEPLPLVPPPVAAKSYPVKALGPILGPAAKAIAERIQCSPALAAQSVLAAASLAAQRLADVRLPFGQVRPLTLFFVTLAGSGDRKSSADNEALIPIRTAEAALCEEYQPAFERWKIAAAAFEAERKKIEADRKVDRTQREAALMRLGQAPAEPIRPIIIAPEPTVEGLAKFWNALPGSIGLFSAEGGAMVGGHGFGPDHKLKTAAALSLLWDGSGVRRVRAGDGVTDLPGRRLALHLLIQPDAGAAFLSDPILRDQGLLSRTLIAGPESLAGTRLWKEPAPALDAGMKRYTAVLLDLLRCAAPAANSQGNELTPRPLSLSPQAKSAWEVFYNEIEIGMSAGGPLENLRDVAGKAAENVARIAGVLAIISDHGALEIDGAAMASACNLMLWYLQEATRLSGLARQPPGLRNAVKLLAWLQDKGMQTVTRTEIMQLGPRPVRLKADADAAVAVLVDHGWLVPTAEQREAHWRIIGVQR